MRTLILTITLLCASACAGVPQVPEIPKQATDAVENAATFVGMLEPIKEKCSKPDAFQDFCNPFMVAESRLERSIVEAKRLLVAGQSARDALNEVREAVKAVWDVLTRDG